VTEKVIRGEIGFDGLLMSDDLSMNALSGTMEERAEAVIRAGSDLALHCNGNLVEMEAVASNVPPLTGKALDRFHEAIRVIARGPQPFDEARAEAGLATALAIASSGTESV
jgi:beta-N-acetylhexosaminidase